MLVTLAIAGYRSLRELVIPLQRLNLVTGPNGSGKSNLYRALRLLAETAQGRVIPSLAREGGLQSTLWAGPETFSRAVLRGDFPVQGTRRKHVVSLRLGFASDDFGYAIDLGLPRDNPPAFAHDPEIKRECIWVGDVLRPSTLLVDRRGPLVRTRADASGGSGKSSGGAGRRRGASGGDSGDDGEDDGWFNVTTTLSTFDSMMTHCADPRNAPEMLMLREHMRGWRFYDQFRTDSAAPARLPQIGTHTPVLGHDGADLAAALETIRVIGDAEGLAASVDDAFPGAAVSVAVNDGWFEVEMQQHGLLRPLKAAELSDGTLRYLLWVAALLTPRPPGLLVLNEPETSLHPDLLPALARLIVRAAQQSQVIVVSHAYPLIDALQREPECHSIVLTKRFGDTQIDDATEHPRVSWQWPVR